jgi:8-oxo-dGTP pyrophosphatase MutT (NUDIX family)
MISADYQREGDHIRRTAARECEEEIGVTPLDFTEAAVLDLVTAGL